MSRAGACAHRRAPNPLLLHPATREGRSSFLTRHMTSTTLDTDLLTPLAAYLRLRGSARASFLLESVDQGRLGRYSLVGCGDRIVSFEEAEQLAVPIVGYLGYDHVAKLERTVPLPADGPDIDESRFVVAAVFLRFDHVTGTAEVLVGDAAEVAHTLAQHVEPREEPVVAGETAPFPPPAGAGGRREPPTENS